MWPRGYILRISLGLLLAGLVTGCKSGSWKMPSLWSSERSSPTADTTAPAWAPGGLSKSESEDRRRKELAEGEYAQELARARNLERMNKLDDAREVYQELIARRPDRYEAYHRLGVVADRQRHFREAEGLYTQAIRLNPSDPDLFNDLGYCLLLQGKLAKAEVALLKAVTIQPSNARYRNNLGLVYGYQGRYEDALAEFSQRGSQAEAYCNLAYVHSVEGDHESAQRCLQLALQADPNNALARESLLAYREGNLPPAVGDMPHPISPGGRWEQYATADDQGVAEISDTAHSSAVIPTAHNAPVNAARYSSSWRPNSQDRLRQAQSTWTNHLQDRAIQ